VPPAPRWIDFVAEGCALARNSTRLIGEVPASALAALPKGDGHSVLVIPALFSCDRLTRGFRAALTELGYEAEGWGAGINFGPTQASWALLAARVLALAARSGSPISLVGHSLGGVMARALASEHPAVVRRVITICSPFRLPTASPLAPAYRFLSRWHVDDETLLPRLVDPPPVPTTAIYSPRDGVVAWSSCVDRPGQLRENVMVDGWHSTMLANPETIRVVAERLARR
jgi:pimeloyl-ACP methyl ester carboxylesterase